MVQPRWHKVLADLWTNKARTVLVVLSVAVGVMAVGLMSDSYIIMGRDMTASWRAINPAGGIMFTAYFGTDLLASLRRLPGVGIAEGYYYSGGFKATGGGSQPLGMHLSATDDFAKVQIDRPNLLQGEWPGRREVVLERMTLSKLPVKIGDTITAIMSDGRQRELTVTGFIEDRTVDSGALAVQAYTTMDTLEYLGLPPYFNFLKYSVAEDAGSKEHVAEVAKAITQQFSRSGGLVGASIVRNPGEHPAAAQAASVMNLLAAMGVLTLLLSAFLVVNTVSALLSQQVRYIGVMKAIGARTGQIVGMYVVLLLGFGLLALLIAAPLSLWLGYNATRMIAQGLNFTLAPFSIEPLPLALMAGLSLGVPLLAGLFPVSAGARTTVRAAISEYGLAGGFGRGLVDRFFSHVRGRSRPLLISLRNTVRRKARLVLTLGTLILAGAVFMGVLSTQRSMTLTIEDIYHYFLADVNVDLDRYVRVETMSEILRDIPGVTAVEGWTFANAEVLPPKDQVTGSSHAATDQITIMAPPQDSIIVARDVQAGRWLTAEDENAIVMSTTIMNAAPGMEGGQHGPAQAERQGRRRVRDRWHLSVRRAATATRSAWRATGIWPRC